MYQLIDGKKLANDLIDQLSQQIIDEGLEPQLAVILVGTDPASHLYVRLKEKACKRAGIIFHSYLFNEDALESDILSTIDFLNKDTSIDAILIQLPLPKKFDQQKILDAMDYRKDVDGFHRKNIERYLSGKTQHILPGLTLGIWNLIASTGYDAYHEKSALIISKSAEFAEPLAKLLSDQELRPTIARPNDPQLQKKSASVDILITAVGKPNFITADMVKKGATIIDVGINKVSDKTVGDVDFENVAPKCAFITPVPGGVGPMTVAMLLFNTTVLTRERHVSHSSTDKSNRYTSNADVPSSA